jgi:hypothetical protein
METAKKLWQNRKEKKEWVRRLQSEDPGLEVVHPHAAGIDVGNSAHHVAVRPDRDPQPVRRFECFTAGLFRLADWLKSCGVNTVALQIDRSVLFRYTTFLKNGVLSSVPPIAQQARCPESHHCHGSPARPTGLSHAEVRTTIHRQRLMEHYDQRYRDQQIQSLKKKAAKLGLQLLPALP